MKKFITKKEFIITFLILFSIFFNLKVLSNQKLPNQFENEGYWVQMNNGLYGGEVKGIAIDHQNPYIIYTVNHNGFYKSTDGGKSWKKLQVGTANAYFCSVAIDPKNSSIVYTGGLNFLYKSYDGGLTWESISIPSLSGWIERIDINSKNPDFIYIYSHAQSCFKSTDGGKTWIEILKYGQQIKNFSENEIHDIKSDPNNPEIVFVGTYAAGILKSTDGGKTWKTVYFTPQHCTVVAIDPKNSKNIYSMSPEGFIISNDGGETWYSSNNGLFDKGIDDIQFDPNNSSIIYLGCHTHGLFKSEDYGKNWKNISNNLSNTRIYKVSINPKNPLNIFVGTAQGIYISSDGGKTWSFSNNGIENICIYKIYIDKKNPNIIYASGTGLFKTYDGGKNWTRIDNNLVTTEIWDFVVDKYNSNIIFFTNNNNIYKSEDDGRTWILSNPNTVGSHIGAVEINPLDSKIVYFVSNEKFYKSSDGGKTWNFLSNISDDTDYSCDISIDPNNTNIIYISRHGSGLFKSIDGGKTWKSLTRDKIKHTVAGLNIDPIDSNILYLLTWGGGVYKSFDGGNNWIQINKNMNSCCAWSLSINPENTNELLLSTQVGGGIYYSNNGGNSWSLINDSNLSYLSRSYIDTIFSPNLSIYTATFGGGVYKLIFKPTTPIIMKIEQTISGIKIEWTKSKEGSNPLSGYEIYRSITGGNFELIDKVDKDRDTYIDSNIEFGKKYSYYIRAYDVETPPIYSENSNIVSITTKEQSTILKKLSDRLEFKNINKIINLDEENLLIATNKGLYKLTLKNDIPQIFDIALKNQNIDDIYSYQNNYLVLSEGKLYQIKESGLQELNIKINSKIKFITCSNDFSTIYLIDENKNLYKSTDYGDNFDLINELKSYSKINFISLDLQNKEIIYIGTENGLFKSIDGGKNIIEISNGINNKNITSITFNQYNTSEIFISTYEDNVYFSKNGGKNWDTFGDKNLKLKTNKIVTYPIIPYILYASTDDGLYLINKYETTKILDKKFINFSLISIDKLFISVKDDGLYYFKKLKSIELSKPPTPKFEISDGKIKFIFDEIKEEKIGGILLFYNLDKDPKNYIPIDLITKDNLLSYIDFNRFDKDIIYFSIKFYDKEIIPNLSDFSNPLEINKIILSDKTPPQINISIPSEVKTEFLELKGIVIDKESGIKELKINNENVKFDKNGSFTYNLKLKIGNNDIKIEIIDYAGNKLLKTYSVYYKSNLLKILLQIGNKIIYINDTPQEIDVPPQIIEGRTYLPIRYIAEPIGASVEWDSKEKKVTIKHKNTTIELWINKNTSKVNGVITPIDPNNPKVTPLIISGRTMLPVRFVAENLGCKVDYDSKYKLITITYELD